MLFFNNFGSSELMLRKVWQSVFFLNILVRNLLFLIYIWVSRSEILSFDISYSSLIVGCFAFKTFKDFSGSVLLHVDIKNISSINLRYTSKNVLINGYMNFLSKRSIKMFVYEVAQIVPLVQPFFCK